MRIFVMLEKMFKSTDNVTLSIILDDQLFKTGIGYSDRLSASLTCHLSTYF